MTERPTNARYGITKSCSVYVMTLSSRMPITGLARARRDRFIGKAVADLGDKTVLEIGSQALPAVLQKYGIQPKMLTCIIH